MRKHGIAWLLALGIFAVLVGCGEDRTPVNKLNEEVLELHDTAMAKMDVIYAVTKDLKERKEAFSAMPAEALEDSSVFGVIDDAIVALDDADAAMFDWMAGYEVPDPEMPVQDAMAYLEVEKASILGVDEQIDFAVANGRSVLEQNPAPVVKNENEE